MPTRLPCRPRPHPSRPVAFSGGRRRPGMEHHTPRAALISGSPSPQSKSRALLGLARERLAAAGYETAVIELAPLPAEALLGRKRDGAVEEGLVAVGRADIVVASSPVYRSEEHPSE